MSSTLLLSFMDGVIVFHGDLAPIEGKDYQTFVAQSMENLSPLQNTIATPSDNVSVSLSLDAVEIYFPNGKPVGISKDEGRIKYLYIPISAWRDSN